MQHTSFLATLVLLVTFPTVSGAVENRSLFMLLDHNQDGMLHSDEIDTQHVRLFERLLRIADENRDQRLTAQEFQFGLQPRRTPKIVLEKTGSELPGADALLLLIAKMDVSGNGEIEADEVPPQYRAIFSRIEDRLGGEPDGVLDRQELTLAAPKLSHAALRLVQRMGIDVEVELALLSEKQWQTVQKIVQPRRRGDFLADPKRALKLFRRLDGDGDGHVTAAEVPEELAERFDRLLDRADRDRDDQLSEQELLAVSRRLAAYRANSLSTTAEQQGVDRLLKQFDRNRDGGIDSAEAPPQMARRFEQIDSNGDRQLDREELGLVVQLLSRLRNTERDRRNPQGP